MNINRFYNEHPRFSDISRLESKDFRIRGDELNFANKELQAVNKITEERKETEYEAAKWWFKKLTEDIDDNIYYYMFGALALIILLKIL